MLYLEQACLMQDDQMLSVKVNVITGQISVEEMMRPLIAYDRLPMPTIGMERAQREKEWATLRRVRWAQ